MSQTDNSDYSTQKISPQLVSQIIDAIKNKAWGSIEIYVENFTVTQITERTITKVSSTKDFGKPALRKHNGQNHKFKQDLTANT